MLNRKKQLNEHRKRQIVKNWLSSFVTTSAVLVSAVVISQTAPSAEFLNVGSVGTSVYYEVQIEDESLSLYEDSIKIVAKSSLDEKVQAAFVGYNEGVFYDLQPNVEYIISVIGNTGFGEYDLISKTVKTTKNYGGELISATFTESYYQSLECEVKGLYNDLKNEISELKVVYSYHMLEEHFQEMEPLEQIIEEQFFTIQIYDIPKVNGYLQISLIATLNSEETVVLDEKTFNSPYIVNAYAYASYMMQENIIGATVYPDVYLEDASYYVVLKQNEEIIEQKNVALTLMNEYEENYYIGEVSFNNILTNSYYTVEFFITYKNPNTNETQTQLFYTETVATFALS